MKINRSEIWKDVIGFEGLYQVSNLGKIKSTFKNDLLHLYPTPFGYLWCDLYKGKGIKKRLLVHRVVLAAFKEVSKLPIDHINCIKSDNRVINLRYCTNRENSHWRHEKNKNFSCTCNGYCCYMRGYCRQLSIIIPVILQPNSGVEKP